MNYMAELNKHNLKLKKTPSRFCQQYMNKYYIYNDKIYQIVRAKQGFNTIEFIVDKPNGKLTTIIIPHSVNKKRFYFDKLENAKKYLEFINFSLSLFKESGYISYIK